MISDEPIFAHWFSGVLRVPQGEILCYVHRGFGSVYEKEICVRIKHGVVLKSWVRDNRGRYFCPRLRGLLSLPGLGKWFTDRC